MEEHRIVHQTRGRRAALRRDRTDLGSCKNPLVMEIFAVDNTSVFQREEVCVIPYILICMSGGGDGQAEKMELVLTSSINVGKTDGTLVEGQKLPADSFAGFRLRSSKGKG